MPANDLKFKCPNCGSDGGRFNSAFGVLPCLKCQSQLNALRKPSTAKVEFTTENIKDQRKAYAKDIIQPFRKGELSKEYVDTYGTKHLKGITPQEVKKAKPVWDDDHYYKEKT